MSTVSKILRTNLAILVIPSIIVFFLMLKDTDQYASMGYGMFMMVYPAFLSIVALGFTAVYHFRKEGDAVLNRDRKKAYLISAGMFLLIGTSLCFGGIFLMEAVQ